MRSLIGDDLIGAAFSSGRGRFVFRFIEGFCSTRLRTTTPTNCLFLLRNMRSFPRLVSFLFHMIIQQVSLRTIRLLVIMVFCLFTSDYRRALFFAGLVLSTTFFIRNFCFKNFFRFPSFCFFLSETIVGRSNCRSRGSCSGWGGSGGPRGRSSWD